MEEVLVYGLKGGPGHRRRAGHCLSEGRGVRVYRVAAAEALRWGRSVRFGSCSGREPFVPAGQPLVGGLCDTGVRGFRSNGKSSGGGVGVPCHYSSEII